MNTVAMQPESARDVAWTTDVAPVKSPVRAWGDAISAGITEMDVTTPVGSEFRGRWYRYGLGPIDVNSLIASPQRVVRSAAVVSRTRIPDYDLVYLRRGSVEVVQRGERFRVAQGGFVLLDHQKQWDLQFRTESHGLAVHFTDHWLRKWVPTPETLIARPIAASSAWATPLAATLVAIADTGLKDATLPRNVIADQCGALLALLAGPNAEASSSRHNRDMLTLLKRQIEARYEEHDLDPKTIAQTIGISKRHLHGLFARAGTTFGATLTGVRLRRAAQMLREPRFRGFQIGEIAWHCGFADASHFARRFRKVFGSSPMDYRGRSHDTVDGAA